MAEPTNEAGPHEFRPIRRWLNRGRCRHCYVHQDWHPVTGYTTARPLGDKTAATLRRPRD